MPSLPCAAACAFGGSANAPLSPLARLRHCDSAGASLCTLTSPGGSPRAGGAGAPGGRVGHRAQGSSVPTRVTRLGGASEAAFSLDWEEEGSWRETFRARAREACGDTSAACFVRQLQAATAGATCDNCCSWSSAQVKWQLSGDDADALDETEASFHAALQADSGHRNGAALAAYAVFVHEERGNEELASALFERAAALSPHDADVLASWAWFAMKTGM